MKNKKNPAKSSQEMKPSFSETASMEQELEKQLHEQYAINNNAYLSSIITLIVGLFAAIGAYGYVFIHTDVDSLTICSTSTPSYTFSQLLFTALGCLIVLVIMLSVCIYQGTKQRHEQFVIYAIRYKHHSQIQEFIGTHQQKKFNKTFPNYYNPFEKKGIAVIQGLYGEFVKIIYFLIILLFLTMFYKCIPYVVCPKQIECAELIYLIFLCGVVVIVATIYIVLLFRKQYKKYYYLSEEYKEYNTNNNDKFY